MSRFASLILTLALVACGESMLAPDDPAFAILCGDSIPDSRCAPNTATLAIVVVPGDSTGIDCRAYLISAQKPDVVVVIPRYDGPPLRDLFWLAPGSYMVGADCPE